MKKILILSTLFAIAQCLFAQIPLPFTNNNDIINAKNLCRQITPTIAKTQFGDKFDVTGLNGPGTSPNEVTLPSSIIKETHSVWYTFKIDAPGTLKMKIKALVANDDIDFILYRQSQNNNVLSWNVVAAAVNGPVINSNLTYCNGVDTGLKDGEASYIIELDGCQSNNGTDSNGFVPTIITSAGEEYRLFINNWYTNGGFNLDFTGSVCSFTSCSTPLVASIASESTSLCLGASIMLQANTMGGTSPFTYKWATTSGTILSTAANLLASPTTNTTYTLTITDFKGATATATKTITVLPIPVIAAPSNICSDAGTSISVTPSGTYTYAWSNNSTTANIPSTTGTYTVKVSNAACSATKTVTVLPIPVIAAPSNVCSGAGTSISVTPSGTYTYAWSNNSTAVNVPNTLGTHTVTVSNAACSATKTVTVLPTPFITTPSNVCFSEGASVSITPSGTYTYAWSNNSTTANIPSTTGTYTVTVSNAACSSTKTVTVIPTPFITTPSNVCFSEGASISITPSGTYTYAWSNNSTTANIPSTTGTYTVKVSNAACSATKTVAVLPLPIAFITSNPDVSILPICSGSLITLIAATQGNTEYKWNCTTATAPTVTITTNSNANLTNYILTVTGANGCKNSYSVRPLINTAPTIDIARTSASIVCSGTPVALTATASNAPAPYTYKWNMSPNPLATPILTNTWNITATTTRTYTVTVSSAQNCTATKSETITVDNAGCTTSNPPISSKVANNNGSPSTFKYFTEMQLSPNPTNNIVVVTVEQTEKQAIKFELFNNIGQLLETIKSDELSKNHQIRFDLTFRPVGIYYIKANNSLEEITKTLIKQ